MNYLGKELEKFSAQINFALNNYRSHGIKFESINNIVIAGLGGSGIAGRIVKNYFADKIHLPIEVVSDYTLPIYVSSKTLVILSSYSGSTEETLDMYHVAKEAGAQRIVLTTGGPLGDIAAKDEVLIYSAEKGFQPRAALGYSITNLFLIFFELLGQYKVTDLKIIADEMSHVNDFKAKSLEYIQPIVSTISKKYIIVCNPALEGICIRFCQQIQENAKLEAFISVLPEANHNMLETYYGKQDSNFIFVNSGENTRVNLRFHFLQKHLESLGNYVVEINVKDGSLQSLFRLIFELDWISLQIAHQVGAKSDTVPNIIKLKNFLSENN